MSNYGKSRSKAWWITKCGSWFVILSTSPVWFSWSISWRWWISCSFLSAEDGCFQQGISTEISKRLAKLEPQTSSFTSWLLLQPAGCKSCYCCKHCWWRSHFTSFTCTDEGWLMVVSPSRPHTWFASYTWIASYYDWWLSADGYRNDGWWFMVHHTVGIYCDGWLIHKHNEWLMNRWYYGSWLMVGFIPPPLWS